MTTLSCVRCGYSTTQLCNLKKHLHRKTPCNAVLSDDSIESILESLPSTSNKEKMYKCEGCEKEFSSRSGLFEHKKKKHSESKTYTDELTLMKQKYEELEKRQKELEAIIQTQSIGNNNIITTNNNTQNNQNINININNFGQEDISHLTKDFLDDCVKRLNTGMKNLMKQIHFNPEIPENHNIRILSKKQNLLETFDNGSWHPKDKNNTLDEMIRHGYKILFRHFIDTTNIEDKQSSHDYINSYFVNLMNKETEEYYNLRRDLYVMILDNTLYVLGR